MFDFSLVICTHTLHYWPNLLVVLHLQELTPCCSVVAMHRRTNSGAELHWEVIIQPQRNISELKFFSVCKSWKFSLARSGKITWKPQTRNTVLKHFYSLSIWKEVFLVGVNISAQCKYLSILIIIYQRKYLHVCIYIVSEHIFANYFFSFKTVTRSTIHKGQRVRGKAARAPVRYSTKNLQTSPPR